MSSLEMSDIFKPATAESLERLGARVCQPFDWQQRRPLWAFMGATHISFWSLQDRRHWESVDPRGELKEVSPTHWALGTLLRFPRGAKYHHESLGEFEFCGASECYDCDKNGKRRLFYICAVTDRQYFVGVDLLDDSDDPIVYKTDHDEIAPYRLGQLSHFLAGVKRVDPGGAADVVVPQHTLVVPEPGVVSVWLDSGSIWPKSAKQPIGWYATAYLSCKASEEAAKVSKLLEQLPHAASFAQAVLRAAEAAGRETAGRVDALYEYRYTKDPGPFETGVYLGCFPYKAEAAS